MIQILFIVSAVFIYANLPVALHPPPLHQVDPPAPALAPATTAPPHPLARVFPMKVLHITNATPATSQAAVMINMIIAQIANASSLSPVAPAQAGYLQAHVVLILG